MGFRKDAWCRVWSVAPSENKKYALADITISKKNQDSGSYEVTFAHKFVRLVGTAYKQIQNIKIPDKKGIGLQIDGCDVTSYYDKEKKQNYINFVIYAFKNPNGKKDEIKTAKSYSNQKTDDNSLSISQDDLPF